MNLKWIWEKRGMRDWLWSLEIINIIFNQDWKFVLTKGKLASEVESLNPWRSGAIWVNNHGLSTSDAVNRISSAAQSQIQGRHKSWSSADSQPHAFYGGIITCTCLKNILLHYHEKIDGGFASDATRRYLIAKDKDEDGCSYRFVAASILVPRQLGSRHKS